MRLTSFHADVRQLLLVIGLQYGPILGEVRFVVGRGTAADEWFRGKVPRDQLHYDVNSAIGMCQADRGDLILIAPGYTEDLSAADGIDIDVAGVTLLGLGHGELRPTFTYTNAAGEIVIGADSVRVLNLILNASVTDVLKAIDIEANCDDAEIAHCLFGVDAAGTDEFANAIIIGDQANRAFIHHNQCHQGTGAAVSFIKSDADNDYARIEDNFCSGDYSTACIVGDEQDDMLAIRRNSLYNGQATGVELNTEPCIELHANTTGVIENNQCYTDLATKAASIVAADCHLHENYYNEDKGGGATSGIIGTASADD